nr:ATP-binding cassette domain-containing protein [Streptomyces griseus]
MRELAGLSLGQWQRLVLVRAFCRESDFVVLDEPTGSLDPQAEAQLFSVSCPSQCPGRTGPGPVRQAPPGTAWSRPSGRPPPGRGSSRRCGSGRRFPGRRRSWWPADRWPC